MPNKARRPGRAQRRAPARQRAATIAAARWPAHPAPIDSAPRADAIDAMHEGIKAFPAKTAGMGNHLMKPRLDDGVKVFELSASVMQW